MAWPQLTEEEEAEHDSDNEPPLLVPAWLQNITRDNVNNFRVALSTVNEDLPSLSLRYIYFVPRQPYDGNETWEPVTRTSGCNWIITRTSFADDTSLEFIDDELDRGQLTQHLCRALDIKIRSKEIRVLRDMVDKLKKEDGKDRLRLVMNSTVSCGASTSRRFVDS